MTTDVENDLRAVWHDVLSNSIPKLPNLQHLNVFKGEALEGTGNIFRVHCPLFKSVKFYGWYVVLPQSLQSHALRTIQAKCRCRSTLCDISQRSSSSVARVL